jgi:hypothetical protein
MRPTHPLAHLGSAGPPWAINGVEHPTDDAFAVLGVGAEAIALPDDSEGVLEVDARCHNFVTPFVIRFYPVPKRFPRIHRASGRTARDGKGYRRYHADAR